MLKDTSRCEHINTTSLIQGASYRYHNELGGLEKPFSRARPKTGRLAWCICMVFGFALFFCPASYAVPSSLYAAWRIAVIAATAISVLLVLTKNRLRLRWFAILLGSLSYYFLSAAFGLGNENFFNALYNASRLIGIASKMQYGQEKDNRSTIFCFIAAGVAMCCINFIVFLEYHDIKGGMRHGYIPYGKTYQGGQNWFFFSHDNGTLFYYLPVMACLWYFGFKYSRKAITFAILFSAATVAMFAFLWSAAAMVVTGVFLIAMIACLKGGGKSFITRFSYQAAVALGLGFCLFVVFLNVTGSFDYIAALFGKSSSVNSRADIWCSSFSWFLRSPVFGVGYEDDIMSVLRIGINHCHNIIVQLPYTGGLVTAMSFAVFVWACRSKGCVPACAAPLLAYLPLIFVAWTFDFYLYMAITVVPFLLLARCSDDELQNESFGPADNKLADRL